MDQEQTLVKAAGERGASPIDVPIITALFVTIFVALIVLTHQVVGGVLTLILVVLAIAITSGGLYLLKQLRTHRYRREQDQWGPQLAAWLGLSSPEVLHEGDLDTWRSQRRAGVTTAQADYWSAMGIPPTLGLAAHREDVSLAQVSSLIDLIETNGAWDGDDRRELVGIVGFYEGVLSRWLALPADDVARKLRTTDRPFGPLMLHDLEDEESL